MDAFSSYIPVLVSAVVLFILLITNPNWLQGKKYGDKPSNHADPLITSIIIFLAGALTAWFLESRRSGVSSLRRFLY